MNDQCKKKLEIGLLQQHVLANNNCFAKILTLIKIPTKSCKMKLGSIDVNNEKICSGFNDIVLHKIYFPGYCLPRDHPPAWELTHNKYFKT